MLRSGCALVIALSIGGCTNPPSAAGVRTCDEAIAALNAGSWCTTDCETSIACDPSLPYCLWLEQPTMCPAARVSCSSAQHLHVHVSGIACVDAGATDAGLDAADARATCSEAGPIPDGGYVARSCCDVYAALSPYERECPTYCATAVACDATVVGRCELTPLDCNARWARCDAPEAPGHITVFTTGHACPYDAGPDA
jgi:hypothetical protein